MPLRLRTWSFLLRVCSYRCCSWHSALKLRTVFIDPMTEDANSVVSALQSCRSLAVFWSERWIHYGLPLTVFFGLLKKKFRRGQSTTLWSCVKPTWEGLLTWEMLLYEFWMKARSGISMQVRRVNCQDRRSIKNSMPHVFTKLRSNTFTFMATERPILSVSEIKRDVRLPVRETVI